MKPIPLRCRRPLAIVAAAGLVLLAVACSGSASSTDPGGSPNAGGSADSPLLAFSQCMRSHGVPNFPDPQPGQSDAKFPSAQQLGVSPSVYQASYDDCQHLLPAGSGDRFPAAEVQQLLVGMRQFSGCMRSHGVPNWPDPSVDSQGRPVFDLVAAGISRNEAKSSPVEATAAECQHLLPSALGGIPIGGS